MRICDIPSCHVCPWMLGQTSCMCPKCNTMAVEGAEPPRCNHPLGTSKELNESEIPDWCPLDDLQEIE